MSQKSKKRGRAEEAQVVEAETKSNKSYYVPEVFKKHIGVILKWMERVRLNAPETEIEGRIGVFLPNERRFETGIDSKWFNEKLAYFMAPGTQWDRVEDETTTSYLFEGGVRAIQNEDETAVFSEKLRKSSVDLRFRGAKYDVRLSYALEIPKPPPATTSVWVRMRHRKSFFLGPFRYDFSNIIEARTLQEAQKIAQRQTASQTKTTKKKEGGEKEESVVKHEIEIEYVGAERNAEQSEEKEYLAVSLLFKLHDLVTPNGTDCSESALPLEILQVKKQK